MSLLLIFIQIRLIPESTLNSFFKLIYDELTSYLKMSGLSERNTDEEKENFTTNSKNGKTGFMTQKTIDFNYNVSILIASLKLEGLKRKFESKKFSFHLWKYKTSISHLIFQIKAQSSMINEESQNQILQKNENANKIYGTRSDFRRKEEEIIRPNALPIIYSPSKTIEKMSEPVEVGYDSPTRNQSLPKSLSFESDWELNESQKSKIAKLSEEYKKHYNQKFEYLESRLSKALSLEKALQIKSSLIDDQKNLDKLNKDTLESDRYHKILDLIKNALIERQNSEYSIRLSELAIKEQDIKSMILDDEKNEFQLIKDKIKLKKSKLKSDCQKLIELADIMIGSQFLSKERLDLFKKELNDIVNVHQNHNTEEKEKGKILFSLNKWVEYCQDKNVSKTLQVFKLMFSGWKIKCLSLRSAKHNNSDSNLNCWLDILWIRNREALLGDMLRLDDSLQKQKWIQVIKSCYFSSSKIKLKNLAEIIINCDFRNKFKYFYKYRNQTIKIYSTKVHVLGKKIFSLAQDSPQPSPKFSPDQINLNLCQKGAYMLLPYFERFSQNYSNSKKLWLLKWRLITENYKSAQYQYLMATFSRTLSVQLQKEFALRQSLKEKQKRLKTILSQSKVYIDKLVN
ncbi:unnamed protein product [Blepharisma stoltei]|uniref:Uncharacterized protein n=1 Tax=Blepharisma stoltei TaxID=1481888 RepID=A0AAU9IRP7_9CILI|nr:unnamed protein product [Blepharisma stoltei]